MVDNINIEKPLPVKTYSVNKVNEKLKRLEDAIEQVAGSDIAAGTGIEITESNNVKTITNTAPGEIYSAGTGISISEENVISNDAILTASDGINIASNIISLKEWKQITTSENVLACFDENGIPNTDMIIVCKAGYRSGQVHYIMKGITTDFLTSIRFVMSSSNNPACEIAQDNYRVGSSSGNAINITQAVYQLANGGTVYYELPYVEMNKYNEQIKIAISYPGGNGTTKNLSDFWIFRRV